MPGAVPICLHDVMLYKHKVNLTLPVPITLYTVEPNSFLSMRFCRITRNAVIQELYGKSGRGFCTIVL